MNSTDRKETYVRTLRNILRLTRLQTRSYEFASGYTGRNFVVPRKGLIQGRYKKYVRVEAHGPVHIIALDGKRRREANASTFTATGKRGIRMLATHIVIKFEYFYLAWRKPGYQVTA